MQLQKYTYNRQEYYIDYRLQQFRSIPKQPQGLIEFIDFRDQKGDRILCKAMKDNKVDTSLLRL